MLNSPGCNCCCVLGVEGPAPYMACGFKIVDKFIDYSDDDLRDRLDLVDIMIIGKFVCGKRTDFNNTQLTIIKEWMEDGGRVVYMGEYSPGCTTEAQNDEANDQIALLGSSCSFVYDYNCNCTCFQPSSSDLWGGVTNSAVPLMADFNTLYHACVGKVQVNSPADWIAKTQAEPGNVLDPECNTAFIFASIQKIGNGFLIVASDSNLFDCGCPNKPFWKRYCTAEPEDIYGT